MTEQQKIEPTTYIDDMCWEIIRKVVEDAKSRYGISLFARVHGSSPHLPTVEFTTCDYTFKMPIGLHALVLEKSETITYIVGKCNNMVRHMIAEQAKHKRN